MVARLTWELKHFIICGASGSHTHPLNGDALTLIGGSGTQLTHVFTLTRVGWVCLTLTWGVVYLIICGCRRNIGALISILKSKRLHGGRGNHMLGLCSWRVSEDGVGTFG